MGQQSTTFFHLISFNAMKSNWKESLVVLLEGPAKQQNQSIINKKQMSLLCCVDWWFGCFGGRLALPQCPSTLLCFLLSLHSQRREKKRKQKSWLSSRPVWFSFQQSQNQPLLLSSFHDQSSIFTVIILFHFFISLIQWSKEKEKFIYLLIWWNWMDEMVCFSPALQ